MAKIKPEAIVEQLGLPMEHALREALDEIAPDTYIDEHKLFVAFRAAVVRNCMVWETVSDHTVRER
jgi:hypothetical protein